LLIILFIIVTLLIFDLSNICAQSVPCIKIYNFENSASTPALTNDWEIVSGNSYTGQKSFRSQISDGRIRSFSIKQPGDKAQSVEISFWSFSDELEKGEKIGRLLVEFDGKQEFVEYTHLGEWKRFEKTLDGAADHTFKWTYFPGSNKSASCWIDDICIRNTSCPDECPESISNQILSTSYNPEKVTNVPVTNAPVTNAPVTNAPVTNAPVTNAPVTNAPVTNAPVTNVPVTNVPVTNVPVTNVPVTNVPVTNVPVTNVPVVTTTEYLVENGINKSPSVFPTIQSAVNYAPAGSVINVMNMTHSGPYHENVTITKSLKLIGKDNATIQTEGIACYINADDVTAHISQFQIIP
jgi:hypothetical protein